MEPIVDRRRHSRNTCRTEATVVLDEGLTRLPTTIVDASPAGARLTVLGKVGLPDEFYMLFGHRIAPCRLIWRDDAAASVAYRE